MNVVRSLMGGWARAFSLFHIALVKWIVNTVVAVALALPVAVLLADSWDQRILDPAIADGLTIDLVAEIMHAHGDLIQHYLWVLLAAAVPFMLLSLFLSAGTLRAVTAPGRITTAAFFEQCGSYFVAVLCTTFLTVALGAAVLFGVGWCFYWVHDQIVNWASGPKLPFYVGWVLITIIALIFTFLARSVDYARIAVVSSHERRVFKATAEGFRFTWRRPIDTLILWLIFLLTVIGILIGFRLVNTYTSAIHPIWMPVLIGQAALVARIFSRMAWLASEHRIRDQTTPRPKSPVATTPFEEESADPAEYF